MLSHGQVTRLVLQLLSTICLALRYAEFAVLDDLAPCPNGCDRGRYCDTFLLFCESCMYCISSTSPCWSSCSDWLTTTKPPTNDAAKLSTGANAGFTPTDAPPKKTSDAFISLLTTSNTNVADLHVAPLIVLLIAGFVFLIIGYWYCFRRSALRKCLSRSSTLPKAVDTELQELPSEPTTPTKPERQQLLTVGCSSDNPVSRASTSHVALQQGAGPISVPQALDPAQPFYTQYSHQGEGMNTRENPLNALDTEMFQQTIPTTSGYAHHHTPRPALSQTVTDGTLHNHEIATARSLSISEYEAGASRDAS